MALSNRGQLAAKPTGGKLMWEIYGSVSLKVPLSKYFQRYVVAVSYPNIHTAISMILHLTLVDT